jgi:hypothetical protein
LKHRWLSSKQSRNRKQIKISKGPFTPLAFPQKDFFFLLFFPYKKASGKGTPAAAVVVVVVER